MRYQVFDVRRAFVRGACALGLAACMSACDNARPGLAEGAKGRVAGADATSGDSAHTTDVPRVESLAHAGGGSDARSYKVSAVSAAGALTGRVVSDAEATDTTVVPTHDLVSCPRFTQRTFVSNDHGVGEVAVWLAGVAAGPADDAPRRATVMLDQCQLDPRVQRIASGGTLIVNSRDAVRARLRFTENGAGGSLRAVVTLNDAGQVVPNEQIAKSPGIVAIRDDLHPWIRGYVLVTPHPFVAVTSDDGSFRFTGVPAGAYTLVTWHERFGTHTENVTVTNGGETKVEVRVRSREVEK